ncbi:glycosyltransferase family 4 protein [Leptospira levettii]|uniref:Glycosyltransferase family 4 protein n=1 Tax=Leptospira levettii TaxID=2023178 RepID=A0AAW5VC73_9LEPT|nr:glycosyltransferase family 4 protein [Leptospira levettii]MCW7511067.1 glycosyltransferase family 4 protein [Leptospira levettii]MCW7514821.1 glycosyltransferase family 4 protein [Leptospira levettii]
MVPFFPISFLILGILSLILHTFYVVSRFGVKDVPNERSLHDTVTKKSGGMFFIPVFLLSTFLFLLTPSESIGIDPFFILNEPLDLYLLLAGVFIFSILGFVDDLYHLTPKLRLFVELGIVFFCLWGIQPNVSFLGFELIPSFIQIVFLTIFLVFGINLVNFMDGMDWYLVTTFAICFISLGFILPNFYTKPNLGYSLYAVLFVSMFGFIFYNFPKAKLFMGDSGSLALGFFGLVLPLLYQNNSDGILWDVSDYFYLFPFFWIDGVSILIKRFFQKKHLFQAHREHLYQKLTETKLGKIGSLVVFSLLNVMVVCFHFLLREFGFGKITIFLILFVISILCYGIVWFSVTRKNLA